jgi:hypothetical protein
VDEFERVIRELDALSNELHMISEHAVQLDANFSKYGYSAHLRTKDASDESTSSSVYGDNSGSFDKDQWAAERKLGGTMRFYQKPIVRQYFHKGLLWRAREAQEVASYELFVDLFYVGIIAVSNSEGRSAFFSLQVHLRRLLRAFYISETIMQECPLPLSYPVSALSYLLLDS